MQDILIINKALNTHKKAAWQHQILNYAVPPINNAGPILACDTIISPSNLSILLPLE